MRRLLTIVILLAIILLGAPYLMGFMAQKHVNRFVDRINKRSAVKVDIVSYERGWWSSLAKIEIKPLDERFTQFLGDTTITATEHIKHGPVIISDSGLRLGMAMINSTLAFSDQLQEKLNLIFNDQSNKPRLVNNWLISLTGSSIHKFEIPAFDFVNQKDGGEVSWKGLNGQTKLSSNFDAAHSTLKFSGVTATSKDFEAQVANISSEFNTNEILPRLWTGEFNVDMPRLSVKTEGQDRLLLTDFNLRGNSYVSEGLLFNSATTKLGKIVLESQPFGPGSVTVAVNKLDVKTYMEVQQRVEKMRTAADENEKRAVLMSLVPLLPGLLDKGAEIRLDNFDFTMPEGVIHANGVVKINLPGPDSQPLPQGLQTRLDADLAIVAPKAWVRKILILNNQRKIAMQQAVNAAAATPAATPPMQPAKTIQPAKAMQAAKPIQSAAAPALSPERITEMATAAADKDLAVWVQQNVFAEKDDGYHLLITFKQGALQINGQQPEAALQAIATLSQPIQQ